MSRGWSFSLRMLCSANGLLLSVQDLRRNKTLRLTVWIERNLALLLEKDDEWIASKFRIDHRSEQIVAADDNVTARVSRRVD